MQVGQLLQFKVSSCNKKNSNEFIHRNHCINRKRINSFHEKLNRMQTCTANGISIIHILMSHNIIYIFHIWTYYLIKVR